jgi:RNA-directed DNA polymerase
VHRLNNGYILNSENSVLTKGSTSITGATKEVLESTVKPVVEAFLQERGLSLSVEKTLITPIEEGFDFLGFNIRKYNGKFLIKPSKKGIKEFLQGIRETISTNKSISAFQLILLLNPKIRGWSNYYRHVVSKKTFAYIDDQIFQALWRWCKRRHPNKNLVWMQKKYFRSQYTRNWVFSAPNINKKNSFIRHDLVRASDVPIRRYIKIQAKANPYDPAFAEYFARRDEAKQRRLRSGPRYLCYE